MKEYDRVRLIVEKEKYAQDGAHKGKDGWICDPRKKEGQWLVCFDDDEMFAITIISVREEDLELVRSA